MKVATSLVLAIGASASCPQKSYTCCALWDIFGVTPAGQACVEDEPSKGLLHPEKNNCKRNGMSKVTWWARLERPEWRKNGVCTKDTQTVTRAELEAREKHDHEFKANYTYWCDENHAGCKAHQTCFYDKFHIDGDSQEFRQAIKHMGPVCVCTFPAGRENADGSGDCVICKNGPDGRPAYTQRPNGSPDGPGAESFGDGDLACASGKTSTSTNVEVLV